MPAQREAWLFVVQRRASALRALEIATLQAQARVAEARAQALSADESVQQLVRSYGLDPGIDWRLDGSRVVRVEATRDAR